MMDSVPVLAITGQVASSAIGSDAFQEADVTGITMPITKHNELVRSVERIPEAIKEAFHVARSGRPGPVLVDIPKDILNATFEWTWNDSVDLPGYKPTVRGHGKMVREALDLIATAQRPVIYAGGGLVRARAADDLERFASLLGLPVVTTLMARGVLPDTHELFVGMPGMHGHYAGVRALQETDLLVTLGARFDDRVTGKLDSFAPGAKVIHVDVDPPRSGRTERSTSPSWVTSRSCSGSCLRCSRTSRARASSTSSSRIPPPGAPTSPLSRPSTRCASSSPSPVC
jgi:acetolactate synthase I/II/III large subunit